MKGTDTDIKEDSKLGVIRKSEKTMDDRKRTYREEFVYRNSLDKKNNAYIKVTIS